MRFVWWNILLISLRECGLRKKAKKKPQNKQKKTPSLLSLCSLNVSQWDVVAPIPLDRLSYCPPTTGERWYSIPVRTSKPRVPRRASHGGNTFEKHTWSCVSQCVQTQGRIHAVQRGIHPTWVKFPEILFKPFPRCSLPLFPENNFFKVTFCAEDSLNFWNVYHKT